MKIKPILFNTEMIRAILEGQKTVTRRVVKPQPICHGPNVTFKPHGDDFFLSAEKNCLRCRVCGHDPEYSREGSNTSHHWIPPHRPGDILYVRETWQYAYNLDGNEQPIEGTGRYLYAADNEPEPFDFWVNPDGTHRDSMPWRPSIHMPREAARIFLRVTDVRVERLQDIGGPEIITKEGASSDPYDYQSSEWYDAHPELLTDVARATFAGLWDSTIKPADRALYGWDTNPWVWVIEFERISKEEAENG